MCPSPREYPSTSLHHGSKLRHKPTQIFFAVVFFLFVFLHCDYILTTWDYFIATGGIVDRLVSVRMGMTGN